MYHETFWLYETKQRLGQFFILLNGSTISGLVATERMKSVLRCTHIPKIYKPPQNPERQKNDMKTVPQWGTTIVAISEPGHVPKVVWAVWARQLSWAGDGDKYRAQHFITWATRHPGFMNPLISAPVQKQYHYQTKIYSIFRHVYVCLCLWL
jgi:hypothetical protein